jgi:hypothetical protein
MAISCTFLEYRLLLREHTVTMQRCEQWSRDYDKLRAQYRQLIAKTFR